MKKFIALLSIALYSVVLSAQDRLKTMPGYEQAQKAARELPTAVKMGSLPITWNGDSKTFEYAKDGKRYSFDVSTRQATEIGGAPEPPGRSRARRGHAA